MAPVSDCRRIPAFDRCCKTCRVTVGNFTETDPGRHEWERLWVLWHVVFGVLASVTIALIAVQDGTEPQWRWSAIGCLVLLVTWYIAAGSRAVRRDDERLGTRYLILAVPLTLIPFTIDPVGAIMLFILYPHVWMVLPHRKAAAATVATVVATGAAMVFRTGFDSSSLFAVVASSVAALVFTAALGLWITKIVGQSQQRAELVTQLNNARAELAEAGRQAGVAAERERLARDIHDTLAQGFTALALLVEAAKSEIGRDDDQARHHLGRAGSIARENLDEARILVHALTPTSLCQATLPEVLRRMANRSSDDFPNGCTFDSDGDSRALAPAQEIAVLRTVQEAVANARTHSRARSLTIELRFDVSQTRVDVSDDGLGFDATTVSGGYGLTGMRSRVTDTGGELTVDSGPGRGTTITARWPA